MQVKTPQKKKASTAGKPPVGCEGRVHIPKFGNHPVMDFSSKVDAMDHVPDELIEGTINTTTSINLDTEESNMEKLVTGQATTVSSNESVVEETTQQTVGGEQQQQQQQQQLKDGDIGFVTSGPADKPSMLLTAGVGMVLGAAANFDQPLTSIVAGGVLGAGAAAAATHFLDENVVVYAAAAALAVGVGARFVAPMVFGSSTGTNSYSDENVLLAEMPINTDAGQFV